MRSSFAENNSDLCEQRTKACHTPGKNVSRTTAFENFTKQATRCKLQLPYWKKKILKIQFTSLKTAFGKVD